MKDDVIRSLSSKLQALWDDLDAEERRLFALAVANSDGGAEVEGFAETVHLFTLLPALKTGFLAPELPPEWTDMVTGPRGAGSGPAAGILSPRDPASGLPSGKRS